MTNESDKKFCIACGNEKAESEDFCEVCQALIDETFYHIPTEMKARLYAKKYLKKKLNHKERKYIKDLYKDAGDSVIGTMPSKCPFCFRLSKNEGEFVVFKKDSKEYQRHVVDKEKAMAVCSPCGNLAHFLKEFYDLDSDQINKLLKQIKKFKLLKIKKKK